MQSPDIPAGDANSVYLLAHSGGKRCYIGATVNVARRLRQHNGTLAGGARRTARARQALGGEWCLAAYVSGFATFQHALQFEWAFKHVCKRFGWSRSNRLRALAHLLQREQWTHNAPPAGEAVLTLHIVCCHPETLDWPRWLPHRCRCTLSIVDASVPPSDRSASIGEDGVALVAEDVHASGTKSLLRSERTENSRN